MQRPGCSLVELTLDHECALVRLVGDLELNPGAQFRQDEGFANFKVLDHERPSLEELRRGLNYEINESRGRKNDTVLDPVIFEKRHVTAVQPNGPSRHRARDAKIEQASAAWCQSAFAPGRGLVPPTVTIPGVSGERQQTTRWGHRLEVERHSH